MTDKSETTTGLSVVPELPEVAWQDGDFVQSERPVDLCSGDASAWIPLTPHAPAQAIIERLEAKLKEQALQYLSDNGQWIEETERLTMERDEAVAEAKEIRARWNDAENEFAALKAKQVADIDEVMELAQIHANAHAMAYYADPELEPDSDEIAGRMKLCGAAREALRAQLTKDRT